MEPARTERLDRQLTGLLQGLVSKKGVKHAIMAIERGDGSLQWRGALGEANPEGTPMREDTPFFLASVTKLYIAAVVLKLCERGRVEIEAPFTRYLPGPLAGGLHRLGGVDHTGRITVRHLLSHTSGLPDWLEDYPKRGPSLIERLYSGEDRTLGIAFVTAIIRDGLTPHFVPQPLEGKRVRARYSDTNYQLLMAIIESVVGQPVPEVFEELLFRPLGLQNTWFPGRTPLHPTPDQATLWVGGEPFNRPLVLESVGDLYSTAADTLRFLRALVRGDLFDDPATAPLMKERWNRFGFPLDRGALRAPGWPIEYGLGLMRFQLPRLFTPLRPVPAVIGHTGSTGSWLFHAPDLDLYMTGTVDQATAGAVPYRLIPKLLRVVRAALEGG